MTISTERQNSQECKNGKEDKERRMFFMNNYIRDKMN